MIPDASFAARFQTDFDALVAPGGRIGVAVSGGPDSLALLLLATAARMGLVEAATVDHGLRPGAAEEAEEVARICRELGIPHSTLNVEVEPGASIQAQARDARYSALTRWAERQGLSAVATAHHLDDQAETVLMRIARGAGVGGLSGMPAARALDDGIQLVRPLLGWRRAELGAIVEEAGLTPAIDPSNSDRRFDRTRARDLLASVDWLDPERLAAVASHSRDAQDALDWAAREAVEQRLRRDGDALILDPAGLPRELRRRLLLAATVRLGQEEPPGPQVMRALEALERGEVTTLAGLKLEGGSHWRLSLAPPRRTRSFTP